jgi:hypothetical protein
MPFQAREHGFYRRQTAPNSAWFCSIHAPHPLLHGTPLNRRNREIGWWWRNEVPEEIQVVTISLECVVTEFSVVGTMAKEPLDGGIKCVHIGCGL